VVGDVLETEIAGLGRTRASKILKMDLLRDDMQLALS